jgi:hypothetical protein
MRLPALKRSRSVTPATNTAAASVAMASRFTPGLWRNSSAASET